MNLNADERFVNYYAEESSSEAAFRRVESVYRVLLRQRKSLGLRTEGLDVVDIGCGAGTQTLAWARAGHRASGFDVSSPLIELATSRAGKESVPAHFYVGSATDLPCEDRSADVVLLSELLEHIPDWQQALNEALRILRPGGLFYCTTTNRLCPKQQEFDLPLYSWYPARMKRFCERRATTTHRHWVQYATLPAVHWFSYYQLRDHMASKGVYAKDRFDIMEPADSALRSIVRGAVVRSTLLRFLGQVLTSYTVIVGIRQE